MSSFQGHTQPGNSSPVVSVQKGKHKDLGKIVRKHLLRPSRRPVRPDSLQALQQLTAAIKSWPDWILDAGCGTGRSTIQLAEQNPQSLVVGLDRSAERLERVHNEGRAVPDNAMLLRVDLQDAWIWFANNGLHPGRQYILYPNPNPKPELLQRRWHGNAVFAYILATGGLLEVRSNWLIYIEEFAESLRIWQPELDVDVGQVAVEMPLTEFEDKYNASGHSLWRIQVDLNPYREKKIL